MRSLIRDLRFLVGEILLGLALDAFPDGKRKTELARFVVAFLEGAKPGD